MIIKYWDNSTTEGQISNTGYPDFEWQFPSDVKQITLQTGQIIVNQTFNLTTVKSEKILPLQMQMINLDQQKTSAQSLGYTNIVTLLTDQMGFIQNQIDSINAVS